MGLTSIFGMCLEQPGHLQSSGNEETAPKKIRKIALQRFLLKTPSYVRFLRNSNSTPCIHAPRDLCHNSSLGSHITASHWRKLRQKTKESRCVCGCHFTHTTSADSNRRMHKETETADSFRAHNVAFQNILITLPIFGMWGSEFSSPDCRNVHVHLAVYLELRFPMNCFASCFPGSIVA